MKNYRGVFCGWMLLAAGFTGLPTLSTAAVAGTPPTNVTADQPGADQPGDIELPEAETFLNLAAEAMAKYHKTHGTYASQWHQLHFDYAYPTYHMSDPDIWPLPKNKNQWHPRGSHYTYVIVAARQNTFLVRALDSKGKPTYELRQGMLYPQLLGQPKNKSSVHK
ncbi:MAG: hypothetical protein JO316_01440 [Abitibacteriaceae bacterium]|nr:hypothetical protein [Abditibacteriaceae bacterium]